MPTYYEEGTGAYGDAERLLIVPDLPEDMENDDEVYEWVMDTTDPDTVTLDDLKRIVRQVAEGAPLDTGEARRILDTLDGREFTISHWNNAVGRWEVESQWNGAETVTWSTSARSQAQSLAAGYMRMGYIAQVHYLEEVDPEQDAYKRLLLPGDEHPAPASHRL